MFQEEGVSTVEFVGPDGQPLPDESTVGDAAWHGGFEMNLDGKQVSSVFFRDKIVSCTMILLPFACELRVAWRRYADCFLTLRPKV